MRAAGNQLAHTPEPAAEPAAGWGRRKDRRCE